MFVFIPLCGRGERFKQNGYAMPKALVRALGQPILLWLLKGILNKPPSDLEFVYIAYSSEYECYRLGNMLKNEFPDVKFRFLVVASPTRGAADTLRLALRELEGHTDDQPVVSLDSDTFYTEHILARWDRSNQVGVFESKTDAPLFSYARFDDAGFLDDIREKEKISDHACSGFYAFASWCELYDCAKRIVEEGVEQHGEFYISGILKLMIARSACSVRGLEIQRENIVCLGTPLQLRFFCNNAPAISCTTNQRIMPALRICFDLDNTLVTFPSVRGDYSTVRPVTEMIKMVRYLCFL
jgi:dTDP-glucose pyrophosphorylase